MKIAIVGTAPSSRHLAPFANPEWECWLMGPAWADEGNPMTWDRWFELHPVAEFDPSVAKSDPGYLDWLTRQEKPVYMRPPLDPRIGAAQEIPWDRLHQRYGGYFLDSTVAWMMAFIHADFEQVDEVALYGIDFASQTERAQQKKGCFHFIYLLRERGVTVTVPDQSDMGLEPSPYPYSSRLAAKLMARRKEHEARMKKATDILNTLQGQIPTHQADLIRMDAAIETIKWLEELA